MRGLMVAALGVASVVAGATAGHAAKIVVEAEKYTTTQPSMCKIADTMAGGRAAVQIPLRRPHPEGEAGPGDTGHATYTFSIVAPGTYQFWARAWWYDAFGNSFFVLLDGNVVNATTPWVTDQAFRMWHWVAGPVLKLSQGTHTLRIQNREDGARLDQWLLTTTPRARWKPTRIEKATM
jgi:hypothetical protein